MPRGFSASLPKRPNVDAARRMSPDNYDLPLRGKLINPRSYHSDGIELRGVVSIIGFPSNCLSAANSEHFN
jgi:hypothetical protein